MSVNVWKNLRPGPNPPSELYALIEIPMGSRIKYEMDHDTGVIFVDRYLYTAFEYPFDYGFIPQTWYYDDDPVDIMVLTRIPAFPGSAIVVRPIGFIRMKDEKGEDNKIIAVPKKDPKYDGIKDINDIAPSILAEIKHFMEHYKELEPGKWVKVDGLEGADVAKKEIMKAIELYKEKIGKQK